MDDPSKTSDDSLSDISLVCVAVRCRPLWPLLSAEDAIFLFPGKSELVMEYQDVKHQYHFDHVFDPSTTQADVFQALGEPHVQKAFEGYECTLLAYGPTGTGKTYTMLNYDAERNQQGITPRVGESIFAYIHEAKGMHGSRHFLVQCSFLQIYNEVIHDLLLPPKKDGKGRGLEIREQKGIGVYVQDLTEVVVDDADTLIARVNEGLENRETAATRRNKTSSRSHCIITIKIHIKDDSNSSANTVGKISLVDLAGSERVVSDLQGGQSKEGANINKSLCALGNVIKALSSSTDLARKNFVPYRDSKLTRLLQESLGGNNYCTMIATVTAAPEDVQETLSTLNYARRAKNIKHYIKRYDEADQAIKLKQEVAKLRAKLESEVNSTKLESEVNSTSAEEHVHGVEGRYQSQIEALESVIWQSWDDKQRLSEQHEQERRAAAEHAQRVAEDRQRRLVFLEQNGKPQMTIDAMISLDPVSCADLSEEMSGALTFGRMLFSQLRVVRMYRESVGTDFAALWQLRRHHGKLSIGDADVVSACTLLAQAQGKLVEMIRELEALKTLAMRFQELMCMVAPAMAVACCRARDSSRSDLLDLLALLQRQLAALYSDELFNLDEEISKMHFGSDLLTLAKCIMEEEEVDASPASSSSGEVERFGGDAGCEDSAAPRDTNRLSSSCLHAMLDASTHGIGAMLPHKSVCQLPQPLGLSTGDVPDEHLTASSNAHMVPCARLLQTPAYGGWSPSSDTEGEYFEVDLEILGNKAVVGVSLQGRMPCSGHWSQTHALLHLALSLEQNAQMNAYATTFMRPPVRLVHDVATALLYGDSVRFYARANERKKHSVPGMCRKPFAELTRVEKAAFFDNLIQHTHAEFGSESLSLTSEDILTGKNCQETNRLLQLLAHLSLRARQAENMRSPSSIAPQWTTAWKLSYCEENHDWRWYGGDCLEKATVFVGNVDAIGFKLVLLPEPLYARKLRLHPVAWHQHPALRLEIHTADNSDGNQSFLPSISAEALISATQLLAKATMQFLDDLTKRQVREVTINSEDRHLELEQRLMVALQRIQTLEARLAETESSLLAAKADNERLRSSGGGASDALNAESAAIVPFGDIGGIGGASSSRARPQGKTAELELVIEELREELAVITDERDSARLHEEDSFHALNETQEELKKAQENYMSLVRRLQQRSLELFNTLELMDSDWALSDLEASEELLYEGYFIEFAGSQKLVPVDNPRLRNFILRHTGISKGELNTELLKVASLNECFQLDLKGFLQLLRDTPVAERNLLEKFFQLGGETHEQITVQNCRNGLSEILTVCRYGSVGKSINEREGHKFEHIMDRIMADAGFKVSLEQWLHYCRKSARLLRLLYFARSPDNS